MIKAIRRVIAPAVVGVSTAAATLAQLVPGVALAAPRQDLQRAVSNQPGATPQPVDAMPAVVSPGCSASSSPDYGCGKVTVEAQPVAGTFPADAVPEVAGLNFTVTGSVADEDTVYSDGASTCTTSDGTTAGTIKGDCLESDWAESASDSGGEGGTWVAGDPYAVALETGADAPPPPADTLIPAITGTFPDCSAFQNSSPTGPSGCPDLVPVKLYGTYHRIGLRVVNSVTHKRVPRARYELCAATPSAPATGSRRCPAGSNVRATATSNSRGNVVFPGLYLGSPNYSVVPLREPRGYRAARSRRVAVPPVTTAGQAGTLYQGIVKLAPITTTVKRHQITTSANKAVTFNALFGAKHVVRRLKVVKISKPRHGKVHHSGGRITYTPRRGFVGKDAFTYTIRNGVGVSATGKVIVHVTA